MSLEPSEQLYITQQYMAVYCLALSPEVSSEHKEHNRNQDFALHETIVSLQQQLPSQDDYLQQLPNIRITVFLNHKITLLA